MMTRNRSHAATLRKHSFLHEATDFDQKLEEIFDEIFPNVGVSDIFGNPNGISEEGVRKYLQYIHEQDCLPNALHQLGQPLVKMTYRISASNLLPTLSLSVEKHGERFDATLKPLSKRGGLFVEMEGLYLKG